MLRPHQHDNSSSRLAAGHTQQRCALRRRKRICRPAHGGAARQPHETPQEGEARGYHTSWDLFLGHVDEFLCDVDIPAILRCLPSRWTPRTICSSLPMICALEPDIRNTQIGKKAAQALCFLGSMTQCAAIKLAEAQQQHGVRSCGMTYVVGSLASPPITLSVALHCR